MPDGLTIEFGPKAQQVLMLARKSADKHQHNYIGPEHVADAMAMLDQKTHFPLWRNLGFDLASFHQRLLESMPSGNYIGIGDIPYTALTKKLLAVSVRSASSLGHDRIEPEHFLLAFFDIDTQVSALFQSMGLTRASVEEAVLAQLPRRTAN